MWYWFYFDEVATHVDEKWFSTEEDAWMYLVEKGYDYFRFE